MTAPLSAASTRATDQDVSQQKQSSTVLGVVGWEVDVWGRLRSQRAWHSPPTKDIAQSRTRTLLFHGYIFHLLKKQGGHTPGGAKDYVVDGKMVGGFAFVAYPAEYSNSGIMTFLINQDGILLQKDLGKTTTEIASAMTEFDPDTSWIQVVE